MSPIEKLFKSPTWKNRKDEDNLSPFKIKNYDGLGKKSKSTKNKNKLKHK